MVDEARAPRALWTAAAKRRLSRAAAQRGSLPRAAGTKAGVFLEREFGPKWAYFGRQRGVEGAELGRDECQVRQFGIVLVALCLLFGINVGTI